MVRFQPLAFQRIAAACVQPHEYANGFKVFNQHCNHKGAGNVLTQHQQIKPDVHKFTMLAGGALAMMASTSGPSRHSSWLAFAAPTMSWQFSMAWKSYRGCCPSCCCYTGATAPGTAISTTLATACAGASATTSASATTPSYSFLLRLALDYSHLLLVLFILLLSLLVQLLL